MGSRDGRAQRMLVAFACAVATIMLALGIAACGDDTVGGGGNGGEVTTAKGGPAKGSLTISNWPGYIDPGPKGTVAEFEGKTGVSVDYIEDINSNDGFFGKLQPQLEQGESGGRSIFVVADYMAKQMYDLGYLQEINHDDVPTVFETILPSLESPGFDPERKFSVPWQGGMTGIWVDTSKAPEIRSVNDLFDPKYKGKVTMLDELRETPCVGDARRRGRPSRGERRGMVEGDRQTQGDAAELRADPPLHRQRLHRGPDRWQHRRGDRLVGRRLDRSKTRTPNGGCRPRVARSGSENMVIPVGCPQHRRGARLDGLRLPARGSGRHHQICRHTSRRSQGVKELLEKRGSELAETEMVFPSRGVHPQLHGTRTRRRSWNRSTRPGRK